MPYVSKSFLDSVLNCFFAIFRSPLLSLLYICTFSSFRMSALFFISGGTQDNVTAAIITLIILNVIGPFIVVVFDPFQNSFGAFCASYAFA